MTMTMVKVLHVRWDSLFISDAADLLGFLHTISLKRLYRMAQFQAFIWSDIFVCLLHCVIVSVQ